jgi:molybdopterin-synthase adenylyltransferase
MTQDRNDRNVRLFGATGQQAIADKKAVVIGNGGLGAAVDQDLAYLGVLDYRLIDGDIVTATSLNRLKGATPKDVGQKKVFVAKRMIEAIQPTAKVEAIPNWLAETTEPLAGADVVFGCLDEDIHRVEMIKLCTEAGLPFFDLATDIDPRQGSLTYGGRVLWSGQGDRCPLCMDLLDQAAMRRDTMPADALADYDKIYGVPASELDDAGPSVVSINGVVASAAVTEFMVWATGLRPPKPLLTYRADHGIIRASLDAPTEGCPYCTAARRIAA